ncbi:MAG TPA: metallophosphoesterase family protein [Devosia sp.]|nr:metallophosphoesterase family protein [Devosia sp.]
MRIAQISDIHGKPGGKSLGALEQALDWLKVVEPDALIVSGDVGNPGWDESYPIVADMLSHVRYPMLIVPGNVDDRAALRANFRDIGWAATGPLNVSRTVGEVRLVGLDVTVPGAMHGDAAPVLDWLREELTAGEPVLLFMHQHPFRTGFANVDKAPCQNAEALADVILAAPARVLLLSTGHGHRTVFTQFAGVPAMMCPSLAKANALVLGETEAPRTDPPGFALHVIEDGRAMSHVISLG